MIRFTVDSVSDDTFMVYVVRFTIHEDTRLQLWRMHDMVSKTEEKKDSEQWKGHWKTKKNYWGNTSVRPEIRWYDRLS